MSKAKDDYYAFKREADSHHEGLCDKSFEYIQELEAEKAELIAEIERIISQEKIDCNLILDKYKP